MDGGGDGRGTPPRSARRLLGRVVPADERAVVLGELDELFRDRTRALGAGRARWWYRRQVVGFVLRAVGVRGAGRRPDGGGTMGGWTHLIGDVRWAARGLRKRPTFTAVAVATLALGIGANSAVFTLASAHFLTPLPYERPDELVLIWETDRNSDEVTTVSPGNYFTWREETRSFEDVAAFNVAWATLSGDGVAEQVTAAVVAPHFFDVVGVRPVLGPGFDDASVRAADGRMVLLSHGLWVRRYGGDPDVVGRDIRVDGRPHTVAGILSPEYRQPERSLGWQAAEVWFPQRLDDQREAYGSRYLRTVARLAPGVTVAQARQEMDAMAVRMAEAHPEANAGRRIQVWTLDDYLLGDARPVLVLLLVAGAAVLLIVCANVANLTLARGRERRREFAVRAALGSGGGRLVRQVLAESVVLAAAGAVLGGALVLLGRDLLQVVQERFFSGLVAADVNAWVLLGTTGLALTAGLLFGLPLALTASATDLRGALVEGGERAGRGGGPLQNALIVGQVGLATTLVVSALLLTRSFGALVAVPPGFDSRDVVTFDVRAPAVRYEGRDAIEQYFRGVWRELETVAGVQGVAMTTDVPFTTENWWSSFALEGVEADPTDPPTTEYKIVTPSYFGVMSIPVRRGALPTDPWAEYEGEIPVVVNETMAARFWPGEDALGRGLVMDWGTDAPMLRVAAVVGDVLDEGFGGAPEPLLYIPWGGRAQRGMTFVVRTDGRGGEVLGAVRDALGRVDPDIPAAELRMLDDLLAETVVRPRAASLIGALFASIALLVAAAGIYGVLSYLVESRTREIGIRSALGASSEQLLGMVLGHSTRLLAVGLVLGVGGAVLAGRALGAVLFRVRPMDPLSLLGATLLLAVVGTLAAWVPARRAVGVDPREALRAE